MIDKYKVILKEFNVSIIKKNSISSYYIARCKLSFKGSGKDSITSSAYLKYNLKLLYFEINDFIKKPKSIQVILY